MKEEELGPISLIDLSYFPSYIVHFILRGSVSYYFPSSIQFFTKELGGESLVQYFEIDKNKVHPAAALTPQAPPQSLL